MWLDSKQKHKYSDVVECWLRMLFVPRPGQKVFSIFPPVTFGAQPKITHPMAWSTSMSKKDSWNVKFRFGNESKMEGGYVVMVGKIHTCTALAGF